MATQTPKSDKFAMLPESVMRSPGYKGLSAGALKVYAWLRYFAGNKATCWPSQDTLGAESGVHPKSINRIIRELAEAGLLSIDRPGGGRRQSTVYRLKTPAQALTFSGTETPAQALPIEEKPQRRRSEKVSAGATKPQRTRSETPAQALTDHTRTDHEETIEQTMPQNAADGLVVGDGVFNGVDGQDTDTDTDRPVKRTGKRPGKGRGVGTLTADDLQDDDRLREVHAALVEAGTLAANDRDLLWVFSAAEHALRVGDNPGGLFRATIANNRRDYVTADDEDAARRRLQPAAIREPAPKRAPVADAGDDHDDTDDRHLAQMRRNRAFDADRTPPSGLGDVLGAMMQAPPAIDAAAMASKAWFASLTDEQIAAFIARAEQAGTNPKTIGMWRKFPRGNAARVALTDMYGPGASGKAAG
jgi:hypothetical protein